eukprot:g14035.t1
MSIPDSIKNRSGVKATNSLARLCCCIPPLLLAAAFKKLDFILTVAGLIGFVLSLIIPCYLEEASLKFCLHTWGSSAVATPYHSATFSNLNAAKTLMAASLLIIHVIPIQVLRRVRFLYMGHELLKVLSEDYTMSCGHLNETGKMTEKSGYWHGSLRSSWWEVGASKQVLVFIVQPSRSTKQILAEHEAQESHGSPYLKAKNLG